MKKFLIILVSVAVLGYLIFAAVSSQKTMKNTVCNGFEVVATERAEFERKRCEEEHKATRLRLRMRDFSNCGLYPEPTTVDAMTDEEFEVARRGYRRTRDRREQAQKDRDAALAAAKRNSIASVRHWKLSSADWQMRLQSENDSKRWLAWN